MRRTPLFTSLLWSSVGAVALTACGDDGGAIIDARPIDGAVDAYDGPLAMFAPTLALRAECGVAVPPAATLAVRNIGSQTLTINGATASAGFTVTTVFPIDIAPGATADLAVQPPAAVIGTDLGGSTRTGTLALQTNQPGTIGTVALTSTVRGANLALTSAGGQPMASVDLSSSTGVCPAPIPVFVRNTGNEQATLVASSGSGGGFGLSGFSPSNAVAGGGMISHQVTVSSAGGCSGSNTIVYTVTGTVCTETPLSLPASFNISGSSTGCFCS